MLDRLDLLVIGECVADIVRLPGAADQVHPGGSPANVAYGLARLGHGTTLLTQLGPDDNGRLIRDHLAGAGVEVRTDDATAATPSAAVTLDGDGRAAYTFEIAWTLGPVALDRAPRHVHTGSIAAVMEPGAATVLGAVESLRTSATVSYDPNVRPELMGDHDSAVRRVERCVALSDVVKASDEDLEWLYPGQDPERVAERWLTAGPALVLVTRGGDGALAVLPGGRVTVDALPTEVVDTVGAGDAFMSGTLHALAGHGLLGADGRERLRSLDRTRVADVLRHAAASAAVTVARAGANPPDGAELKAALGRS
ncbi:carbohydrate kinase [Streptomyces sp. NBC_00053]|uniref:carbohydrate kinase family protein n=1 Tax=unclassified Streptomyces TaxID=2593676 RepID=UPI002251C156|nr:MULTISPECIES: carbohydrate kinase [unclassified Streptomyces]MCX4398570.1 carbohydrate kinase [Streptomyces sp. NBC_01767]MCX5098725.1 carbohydrate kinase [Streptomyces sp. NBC_00439]MCX5498580.1 carbohydrate kinase [Streptomyces sp. NBC_00052]MCX5552888.1 carbohydrate kinase [Streptomyces sp. NBC_00051]WSC25999.1 carbohydrate kinase [Streptomyces sp. NBC_01768]